MKKTTPVFLAGALLLLLAAVGPAEAAFPGTNGKILYDSIGLKDAEIQSTNPDGTAKVNLTRNDSIHDQDAAWSPDGERIVYVSERYSNEPDLYIMDADGRNKVQLTDTPEAGEFEPTWSPDGTKVAFTKSEELGDSGTDHYAVDLYAMDVDGTGEVRLTDNPGPDSQPAWSPDGSRIAFASSRNGHNHREIYLMNAVPEGEANEPVRLTNNPGPYPDLSPDWSPDGERIVFVSGRDRPRSHDYMSEIYLMNADGTNQTRLTTKGYYDYPDWSPDGKKLAFSTGRLYTMKAAPLSDTNGPRRVSDSKFIEEYRPDWQTIP